ncbi:MAG: long-chain-fatty-acid--CoA ligase [Cyanobacteria bacterium SZAS TMP-1]|nr:long-chain-fatty-acid--CoA ligase [Cyanobacteria bacterium SZAS TMP-1]
MNLATCIKRAMAVWPEREAAVDGQKRYTYKELGARIAALTQALNGLGLTKGSVVACVAPNSVEYLELYFATALLGVVLAPVNYRLSAAEVREILLHCDAELLVSHTDFAALTTEAVQALPSLKMVTWLGSGILPRTGDVKGFHYEQFVMRHWGHELIDTGAGGSDLAQLYYTSGTTGEAKGVMLSHDNVATHALGAVAELQFSDGDVWAHIAPMFHLVDAWAIFSLTWVGGKHVFLPYFKVDEVLPLLEAEAVTATALVPTMVNQLVKSQKAWDYSYKRLKAIMTAGSPIAPELVRQVEEIFGCTYIQFYGMTETSPILTISLPKWEHLSLPKEKRQEIRSKTGRPFICVDLRVVRPDGTDVEHDGVEVGEIIAHGPTITAGYWKNREATAAAIKDGWIYTGDLAVMDSDGYVNIVDRKKDMIISGGENVYSTEVEYVLQEHPAVFECAVFGIPDDRWGEIVKATLVLRPGMTLTSTEVITFVKERLAHYKAPREVEIVDEMPKTGSGKILKKVLRDKHWDSRVKRVN